MSPAPFPPFRAGDKVVVAYECVTGMATVPKLKLGTVYCIEAVTISEPTEMFPAHQRVHLCGVRLHRCMRNPNSGLPFAAFRRVGPQMKEGV